MFLRRAIAGLFISLFTAVALPAFLLFGLSNSVGKVSFYDGPIIDRAFDLLLTMTADSLIENDSVIAKFFNETELKASMTEVFPTELFKEMVKEFSLQIDMLKADPERPIVISMKKFRESLLTFANNLSYKLFKALPVCKGGEIPFQDLQGLWTCVPEGVEYNAIADKFAKQFENSVYSAVPEQMQIDLNAAMDKSGLTMSAVVDSFMMAKYVLYGILMGILVIIALLIFSPFSLIAKYEGIAFVSSGISGLLLAALLGRMPEYIIGNANITRYSDEILGIMQYTFSSIAVESQKIALVFLALGAVLILVRVFLTGRYHEEKNERI